MDRLLRQIYIYIYNIHKSINNTDSFKSKREKREKEIGRISIDYQGWKIERIGIEEKKKMPTM